MMPFEEKYPALALALHIEEPRRIGIEGDIEPPAPECDLLYVGERRSLRPLRQWLDRGGRLCLIARNLETVAAFAREEPLVVHEGVSIELCDELGPGEARRLANTYPFRSPATTGLPSLFAMELLRETAIAHTHLCDDLYRDALFHNLLRNYRRIDGSFDAGHLKMQGVPAIICGAGPSLDVELVEACRDRALIIGGGSAIPLLGERLHLALAFDPNEEEYHRLKGASMERLPLIYGARLHRGVLDLPIGRRGYLRTGTGGAIDLWLEEALNLAPPISTLTLGRGAMSVTTLAVALAHSMGCNPIAFVGCDMAQQDGLDYAEGVAVKRPATGVAEHRIEQGGITTKVKWLLESEAISDYAAAAPDVAWLNATPGGLGFAAIPRVDRKVLLSWPERDGIETRLHEQMLPLSLDVDLPLERVKASLLECRALIERGLSPGSLALLEDEIAYTLLLEPIARAKRRLGPFEARELIEPLDHMLSAWHDAEYATD
jgi:hypothetical protein